MLIDGAFYTLPDGTRVQLTIPLTVGNVWRLSTLDGQPQYLRDHGRWYSLRYNARTDAYAAAPCDLVDADLSPVE